MLSRRYAAREGAPVLHEVDPEIFTRRYYGHCMSCGFCADACCQHGVDVGVRERDRILSRESEIAPLTRAGPAQWFEPLLADDEDFPGGASTRTTVVEGRCVFLRRDSRGCALHALSLDSGADYHLLKPMVSSLFPVTFGGGTLLCSEEIVDGTLVCGGQGPTAYEMARSELEYYFGMELVMELDAIAQRIMPSVTPGDLSPAAP